MMSSLHSVTIAHLMADYSLGYNPLFFGQFALLQDWAAEWQTMEIDGQNVPVQQIYLGSRVSGPRGILTPDPCQHPGAYRNSLEKICREGGPVFGFSHFIHKDAAALTRLKALFKLYPEFYLLIILHCTRDEFLRPWSRDEDSPPQKARDQSQRGQVFQSALEIFSDQKRSLFVAVSDSARDSYLNPEFGPCLQPRRVVTIPNGVSAEHYKPIPEPRRRDRRRSLGLEGRVLLGITNRWTQAKGKDILEGLLDVMEKQAAADPFTFLFPALIHDQLFDFITRIPRRYPRLWEMGKLKAYLDLSKLARSPFHPDLEEIKHTHRSEWQSHIFSQKDIRENLFLGYLEFPVQTILDIYLRPSVAEAFGLGTIEAYLCNVPVLSSDRGGSRDLVLQEHQVSYPPEINLRGHLPGYRDPAYNRAVKRSAEDFYQQIQDMILSQLAPFDFRERVIKAGYTVRSMIREYQRCLRNLREGNDDG